MRHINLHPVTERTGKIHAVQISIRGGTGGGGNRIHGTTLRGQRVHAGLFTAPATCTRTVASPEAPPCADSLGLAPG